MHSNHAKIIFTGIRLLLIVVGAYLLVQGTYALLIHRVEQQPAIRTNRTAAPKADAIRSPKPSNDQHIARKNLFESDDRPVEGPQATHLDASDETRLDLRLWGTVTGITDRPYAVIENGQTRRQGLYRQGDPIQGARVKLILPDRVVLVLNGQEQELTLESPTSSYIGVGPKTDASADGGPVPTEKIAIERVQINAALEDVNQLLKQVNVRPHSTNGRPDGFILSRIAPDSIFRDLGLRNGDIISGVNGEELRTMEDALQFYRDLSAADSVNVQIKRRGRPRILQYAIR